MTYMAVDSSAGALSRLAETLSAIQPGAELLCFESSPEALASSEMYSSSSAHQIRTSSSQRRSSADQFLRTTSLQSRKDSRNAWTRDLLQAARYRV